MAADAIDGDFVPIALLSGPSRTAICRLMVGGEVGVRATEWVDVGMLRDGLSVDLFQTCFPPLVPWKDWQLHCLVAMIALTGTDYSRNLPLVKPKKLWTMLHAIMPELIRCFRLDSQPQLDVAMAVDSLVPAIYRELMHTHFSACDQGCFEDTMAKLRASRLGGRTKRLLPSKGRARCTLRNANFILQYWSENNPQSVAPEFGFREGAAGCVEWDES
jgi:hypothetical protein